MNGNLKQFYKDHIARDKNVAPLSDDAKLRLKSEIFSKLGVQSAELSVADKTDAWGKISKMFLRGYVLAPLLIVIFVTGTTIVSANALPGDTLYPIKRQVENARLFIAPTEESKLNLQVNFAEKRLEEDERINRNEARTQTELQVSNEGVDESETVRANSEATTKREQRQLRARQQADQAVKFLNEAKEDWHQKGKDEKARQIENRVKQFRNDQETRVRSEWNDNVRGDRTESRWDN